VDDPRVIISPPLSDLEDSFVLLTLRDKERARGII
jgi:hypothetical protein